jgi:hypothetical protein
MLRRDLIRGVSAADDWRRPSARGEHGVTRTASGVAATVAHQSGSESATASPSTASTSGCITDRAGVAGR